MTRDLYKTGFMYKNHNSPICCDIRLSSDFQIHPVAPPQAKPVRANHTPQSVSTKPIFHDRNYSGSIGWQLNNPAFQ